MKAKITDVAKKANVSISTVSHVLNHTRFVSEETRKKVMDAVEELGYSPDASGRTFRTGKKMMIGLVVPDITNSVFAALIEDVDDVISKQGYNLVISNTRDNLRTVSYTHLGKLTEFAVGDAKGILFALLAAVCYGLYCTLNKRESYDKNLSVMVSYAAGTVTAFILILIQGKIEAPTLSQTAGMIWNGVICNALPYLTWPSLF